MKNYIKFPINIAPSMGAYSINILIGSQQQNVELLIDTGSSTITFKETHYKPELDDHIQLTSYAQCVTYGKGGWAGPVVKSTMTYTNGTDSFDITNAPFALVKNQLTDSFLGLDGIFGLAYHHLNRAYDLTTFLEQNNQTTYSHPWPFSQMINDNGIKSYKKFLTQYPEHDITPIFTVFEQESVGMNQFSLLTHRAIAHVPKENMSKSELMTEPLNQGLFIVGHIESDKTLFDGHSKDVKVLHDAYYNTHLISVTVEGFKKFMAPPLDQAHISHFFTNAIIDSGSSYLMLQNSIYEYILDCFKQINPQYLTQIEAFNQAQIQSQPYFPEDLDLKQWPTIYFTFEGATEDQITLEVPANHYWQMNAIAPNRAFFTLLKQIPHWPDQSVIGLPLMSRYLCIFDRSAGSEHLGIIKFTEKINPVN